MKTTTKDMSWLAKRLRTLLPDAKIDLFEPAGKGAGWTLDAEYRDHYVVVQWTSKAGFGVSTPTEDDYGTAASEHLTDGEQVFARVLFLLVSGERARSRSVRLQELRELRRLSQQDLAATLKVSQASVSKTERRSDVLVSTLASYVEGLGGTLVVTAKFPAEEIPIDLDAA